MDFPQPDSSGAIRSIGWDYHRKTGYAWWMRIAWTTASELYDVVRIDHFRGFDEYYSIPVRIKDQP